MDMITRLREASTVTCTAADREALLDEVKTFRREAIIDPSPTVYARALRAAAYLPADFVRKLAALRYGDESDLGMVLLRDAPVDAAIPHQPQPTRAWHDKTTCITEAMHLVVHAAAGTVPISYAVENGGDTIATLAPKIGDELKQESSSSAALLELHGEDLAHPFPPDLLVLSNLQEDGRAPVGTIVASNRLALLRLSRHELEIGRRAIFMIDPPSSFRGVEADRRVQSLIPMFHGSPDDPMLHFDAHAMHSIEPEGERLLETMKRVLQEVAVTVYLRRGDILVMDNRIVAHGRVAFQADYDHPRINQRSFGRFDFAATRQLRSRGSTVLRWPD